MSWLYFALFQKAAKWYARMRKRLRLASERSPWWDFTWYWTSSIAARLKTFRIGQHRFSPLIQYHFKDETIQVWSYPDRLALHLILKIIQPTWKYVISPLCLHLKGPSSIKNITQDIKTALNTGNFEYCLRIDIKSYYASIDHKILLNQLCSNYVDPKLRRYFEAIVTTGIDCGGQIILPKKGIPLRSSLSPFFGALYLTALDRAFENCPDVFYRRFMDDILILVKNKRQYAKARKRVFAILRDLKLKVSPHKTRMGLLKKGFHFLGVNFEAARTLQGKIQEAAVDIHPRSCRRALDKVQAMRENSVNPAKIQRYLSLWAAWWRSIVKLDRFRLLYTWVMTVKTTSLTSYVWYGSGLLLGTPYYRLLPSQFNSINQNQKAAY